MQLSAVLTLLLLVLVLVVGRALAPEIRPPVLLYLLSRDVNKQTNIPRDNNNNNNNNMQQHENEKRTSEKKRTCRKPR
jgi:hypothetical protein